MKTNWAGPSIYSVRVQSSFPLPKDFTYSESGNPDEFVIISSEDLTKKKSIFLKLVEVKDYKEKDFEFKNLKKIKVTKASIILLVLFLLLGLVTTILK